jgi:exodeoxyribonuclease VII small subunit
LTTIDERLKKLEAVTQRLEAEDLALEEALALFEEGVGLAKGVKADLDAAKLKVKQVIEEAKGTFAIEDFDLS